MFTFYICNEGDLIQRKKKNNNKLNSVNNYVIYHHNFTEGTAV